MVHLIRNWLHADDTAEAVMLLIENGQQGEIYNIAGGFEQSNIDTVKQVISKFIEIENWYDFHQMISIWTSPAADLDKMFDMH
jgi:dTDP-D-glucose 4,6-dehydratase